MENNSVIEKKKKTSEKITEKKKTKKIIAKNEYEAENLSVIAPAHERQEDLVDIGDLEGVPQAVKNVTEQAVEIGCISKSALQKIELQLTPEKYEALLVYLSEMDINIIDNDEEEKDDDLEEEEGSVEETVSRPEDLSGFSTVNLYLKDMSSFNLLSKEEEVQLSQNIKTGKDEVLQVIATLPFLYSTFVEYREQINNRQLSTRSFVDTYSISKEDEDLIKEETELELDPNESKVNLHEQTISGVIENIDAVLVLYENLRNLYEQVITGEIKFQKYRSDCVEFSNGIYQYLKTLRITNQYINNISEDVRSKLIKFKSIRKDKNKEGVFFWEVMSKSYKDYTEQDFKKLVQLRKKANPDEEEKAFIEIQNILYMAASYFEEQANLLLTSNKKNRDAYKKMIMCNLRLVISISKKFNGRGVPFLDLIQEGNLGLIKAVDRFSPEKGFKVSTYTSWWVKQSCLRAIAEKRSAIRLPVHVVELINKITKAYRELQNQLGRKPHKWEVASHCNITIEKLNKCNLWNRKVSNMSDLLALSVDNEKNAADDKIEDKDSPSQEDVFNNFMLRINLSCIFAELGAREERVIRLRYISDRNTSQYNENYTTIFNKLHPFKDQAMSIYEKYKKFKGVIIVFDDSYLSRNYMSRLSNKMNIAMSIVKIYQFFYPTKYTLEVVGKIFCVTRERARQIEEHARKIIADKGFAHIFPFFRPKNTNIAEKSSTTEKTK